jgi:hypothetical protein
VDSNPHIINKQQNNTMLKGTDPKLTLDGSSTRGNISTAMGNQKLNGKGGVYSSKPLPTVGKPVK